MPTSIITLRYRKSDNSASYVEVNDLFGWLNGSTLNFDLENANKLLIKILYWKLNSTNGNNRGFGDADAYVLGFDGKEHKIDEISVEYTSYSPSPRAYVQELIENKVDCTFNGC